ncbi:erythrocyte membrane protein 1 [Plasmodium falciparum RAJ116]|uniref:Erythrocyte membrane protein 1 n=2 Tax=Plasmodium falciparum TaxID=5833 RepID=A0A0L0CUB0_PLAFA|nr:erythrocyte membrane protein 1 [Plasmodium falciparum RAJ116]
MAPQGRGGGGDDIDDTTAKHLLDSIGKKVHDLVKSESNGFKDDLKGYLHKANGYNWETTYTTDTCELVQKYYKHPNGGGASGERNPCGNGKNAKNEDVKRFSDTLGGQCTYNRIKDSKKDDNKGACAPYRRLHVCDKNMEKMEKMGKTSKTSTDTLLAEVCMAAYYEGDLIKTHYTEHQVTNRDTKSQLCTVLARSFADIGDIVRGKDLYLGYDDEEKKRRDKLENNLKEIFKKIQEKLIGDAKTHYEDATGNFFQLREDWWTANRHTVWEAITCDEDKKLKDASYFRTTCSDEQGGAQANNKCRCVKNDVPTYFDYVPQYLRWFEEWAEDFCRKKKKKLENLDTQCRGKDESGKERYCSGNGYDCTKTIYKKGRIVVGYECTSCSVWCRMYEKWIDNQKKEFLKQKRKYAEEIKKANGTNGTTIKTANGKTINNLYVKEFYEKLKKGYGKVDDFLKLLNEEDVCTKITDKKEKINFTEKVEDHKNINNEGTFYHSEYCEVCPGCGVKKKSDGSGSGWIQKKDGKCDGKKLYTISTNAKSTDIDVLSFGDKRQDIEKKLKKFCETKNGSGTGGRISGGSSEKKELIEKWQCYKHEYVEEVGQKDEDDDDYDYHKEVKSSGGLCILQNKKEKKTDNDPAEFQKTFHDFFYFWIRLFLNDSMYWRGKVNSCINKSKSEKCKEECNTNCECFQKWIDKKKTEWTAIKDHFKTQDGFDKEGESGEQKFLGGGMTADVVLELALQLEQLFQDIKDGYGNAKELEGIKNMLEKENEKNQAEVGETDNQKKTTIDKLLKHEGEEAQECQQKHNNCPKPQDTDAGRSLRPTPRSEEVDENAENDSEEEDNEDVDEPASEEGEEPHMEDTQQEGEVKDKDAVVDGEGERAPPAATTTTKDKVNPCKIVQTLFGDKTNLEKACTLKYSGNNSRLGWKCIPSGDTTGGSICIPPRRRRLYVGKLEEWAEKYNKVANTQASVSPGGAASTSTSQTSLLRDAFIESAAVETFFLWDRYKKIKQKEKKPQGEGALGLGGLGVPGAGPQLPGAESDDSDPQKKLEENGEIPEEFKRQMFYTFGDYKDILFGDKELVEMLKASGDTKIKEWGQNFCKERKKRLEKIKYECRSDKVCSGDGFECKTESPKKEDIFKDFLCPTCARHCRSYRKWIERKRIEFEEQKKAYVEQQKKDAQKNNNNGFCVTRGTCSTAGDFLNRLKNGPCKNNENGKDKTDFKEAGKTFKHTEYCDPCSQFRVKCENGSCRGDGTNVKCKDKTTIDAKEIANMINSPQEVTMLVSDDNPNGNKFDGLQACGSANIFKGIKENKWKCGDFCGIDICTLKKNNNEKEVDEHITVKELVKRWLEYFFEDYNRIQKKLKACTKSGKGCKCIKGCVEQWINHKTAEWEEIKKHYVDNYEKENEHGNNLNSFLEQAPFKNEVDKAIKPCTEFNDFQKSKKCTETDSSENENGKGSNKKDGVVCLLENLKKEIEQCNSMENSGDNQASDKTQTTCDENPTPPDDEEPLEEEENTEEAKKMIPKICGEMTTTEEQTNTEETCTPASSSPEAPPPAPPPGPPVPKPPVKPAQPRRPPKRQPRNVLDHPAVIPALMSSTIMWSIGIGFAAFTYFYLKKKTKSSVGNLFQILQIPKGDYDIPTLKSSNRYIPYASDRYKGKTYIYMEGDSSGDEKYAFMSDTTDVTSSESEYEELDINDMYVPGSPKYKTLIEVVLEPSKRDTMSTQSDIPLNDKLDSNKLTDEEWNKLKQDFISILQNPQNDLPQNNISGNIQMDTHPSVSILHDDMEEKPFITSIHDRDLHNGEEVTYNINLDDHKNMNFSTNHDNIPPKNNQNDLYTGIDLINDSISGNHNVDIYDELLKRKENELFGTNHTKHTTTNSITKKTHNDPIVNQINLFHKWLDRHKNMCEQWDKHKKEELLDKLKKEWEQDYNNNSDDIHTSDNNIVSTVNHVFNTDVSIQIDMDDPNPVNPFTNMYTNSDNSTMDNILNGMEKHREPYFYDIYEDDITYFDIDDDKTSVDHINMDHNKMDNNNSDVPTKVQIEMNIVNNKKEIFEEKYPISDIWNI